MECIDYCFCDRLNVDCKGEVLWPVRGQRMIYKLVNDVLVVSHPSALCLDVHHGTLSDLLEILKSCSCGETLMNTHRDSKTQ